MLKGKPVATGDAIAAARRLIAGASRRVAVLSAWGSNEELEAFGAALSGSFEVVQKADHRPEAGEIIEDHLLIRPDKNPNSRKLRDLFPAAASAIPADADLVLVWGEGCDFSTIPAGAKIIFLGSYLAPENGHADVFLPVSIQTEHNGSYTNFEGVVSRFEACFPPPPGVGDAGQAFAALAGDTP
jgi:NADH-quinone oxidoreductase subunit G